MKVNFALFSLAAFSAVTHDTKILVGAVPLDTLPDIQAVEAIGSIGSVPPVSRVEALHAQTFQEDMASSNGSFKSVSDDGVQVAIREKVGGQQQDTSVDQPINIDVKQRVVQPPVEVQPIAPVQAVPMTPVAPPVIQQQPSNKIDSKAIERQFIGKAVQEGLVSLAPAGETNRDTAGATYVNSRLKAIQNGQLIR